MANTQELLKKLNFSPASASVGATVVSKVLGQRFDTLPAEYRTFLCESGGGDFEIEVVVRCENPPPQADGGRCLLGEFLDVGTGESSLTTIWRRGEDLLAAGLVPIATAAGGDLYCFNAQTPSPAIVFWDHESDESHLVASSFEDFVGRLELAPEAASSELAKIKVTLDPDLL